MKVRCSHCNAAYSVDDEKVAGKRFGFDCPKCGTNVVIDNRQKAAEPEMGFGNPAATLADKSGHVSGLDTFEESFAAEFDNEPEPEIDLSILNKPEYQKSKKTEEDILGSDMAFDVQEEDLSLSGHTAQVEDLSDTKSEEEDESITIDLDSLDIDLAESEDVVSGVTPVLSEGFDDLESEKITLGEEETEKLSSIASRKEEDEDESITLDLDSLDIPLEETGEVLGGEIAHEEDSRISLMDAGLTVDDVVTSTVEHAEDETDFRMTLDELDSKMNLDGIDDFMSSEKSSSVSDELDTFEDRPLSEDYTSDKLPEIDLDKYDSAPEESGFHMPVAPVEDRFLDIESPVENEFSLESDGGRSGEQGVGYVNFSIDYALHYSRFRAFLRLIGIFYITFIPHFIVSIVYSSITAVVSFINYLIILFGGKSERDFSLLQEQTLRYVVSIYASMLNVVEDKPSFAGHKDIDYQLQLSVVSPSKNSRILAFLRLSVVGIIICLLPHFILLSVLTIGMGLIAFMSLVFTIFAGRWPAIMFDFMVRYLRYYTAVYAYMYGLVDTYPSFRFE